MHTFPPTAKIIQLLGESVPPFGRKKPEDQRFVHASEKVYPERVINLSNLAGNLDKQVALLVDPKFHDRETLFWSSKYSDLASAERNGCQDVFLSRYLWVLSDSGFLICLEVNSLVDRSLPDRYKHSNLTQGGEAFAGGELWFAANRTVFFNNFSGRYGLSSSWALPWEGKPKENAHSKHNMYVLLKDFFKSFGWDVICIDDDFQHSGSQLRYE